MTDSRPKADSQLYLIYGNNETEVSNARYDLVCSILSPEERDSGLTEIHPPGTNPLKLENVYGEIIAELGVSSFIADSKRVVVVHDLADLFAPKRGGRKKTTKSKSPKKKQNRLDVFFEWMRDVLPTTENVAIFVCTENDEKQKSVSQESEIFQFFQDHGRVIVHREKPMQYEFEDRLMMGNGPAALMILREWIRRTGGNPGGRIKIYTTISGIVELALQAKCQQEGRNRKVPDSQISVQQWPSLQRAPGFKADKVRKFARRFSFEQLHELVKKLNRLQMIMYPTGDEDYIANWEDIAEMIVMEMTMARSAS